MATQISWENAEDIGILLSEKFPDIDPLTVRFTDLHKYVTELPEFSDDPKKSNEGKLEAIQMAWYEEWKVRRYKVQLARVLGRCFQHRVFLLPLRLP